MSLSHCKPCNADFEADHWTWRESPTGNMEKKQCRAAARAARRRKKHADPLAHQLWRKYKMTRAEYEAMLANQDGVCAICVSPPAEGERLCVDHDHSCCNRSGGKGKQLCGQCNRGLLCHACNVAIGMMREDISRLENAIGYLRDTAPSAT